MAETAVINIRLKNSTLLGVFLLWLMIIVFPAISGSNIFKHSLESKLDRHTEQIRHELMANANETETLLIPERVFQHLVRLPRYTTTFNDYFTFKRHQDKFLNDPVIRSLPDFRDKSQVKEQLESFNRFMMNYTGQVPAAIFHIDEDHHKCLALTNHSFDLNEIEQSKLQNELSQIAVYLNQRFVLSQQGKPTTYMTMRREDYPQLYKLTGSINLLSTDFFRLSSSFSHRTNCRINMITFRFPGFDEKERYLLMIFSENTIPARAGLKSLILRNSRLGRQVSFGFAKNMKLPHFYQKNDSINLLIELPYRFKNVFDSQVSYNSDSRPVLRFSHDFSSEKTKLHQQKRLIDLCVFLYIFLVPVAVFSFYRRTGMRSLKITTITAFFLANLLPLSGSFWLFISYRQQQRESEIDHAVNLARQKIWQSEQAFRMQRLRQLMLLRFFCFRFENARNEDWRSYLQIIGPERNSFQIRQFLYYNFLLIDSYGREQMRAGSSEGKGEELRPMLLGDELRLMLKFGAFRNLKQAEQSKISQTADIAAGLTEQIADRRLYGRLFSDEGFAYYSTSIVRNQLINISFIRKSDGLAGIFNSISNQGHLLQGIAWLMQQKALKTDFKTGNYMISLDFYPISPFSERAINGRIHYSPGGTGYVIDRDYDLASSIYANANSSVINNLDTVQPHLLVTDVVDREVFVLAKVFQVKSENSFTLAIPLLIISLISCFAIASGISAWLLLPIPPFLRMIKQLEQENYELELDLKTGDQFASLGESFNKLALAMLERGKMARLVSKSALDAVSGNQTSINRQARLLEASVLFSDVRNFTTITEQYDAELVVEMLNEYLTIMTRIIEKHGGYVDKIIGDAIQAVFIDSTEMTGPLSACSAAVEMRRALSRFNGNRQQLNMFTINNGIGIATGQVISGLVGSSEGKLDATIFGQPLVMAQQLESLSKYAQISQILVDHNTHCEIKEIFETEVFKSEKQQAVFEIKIFI
ncbi:MAG: adenylate/guanylate cyclase domain-containing protein [Candidatus Rifleibacteriota bacterium]